MSERVKDPRSPDDLVKVTVMLSRDDLDGLRARSDKRGLTTTEGLRRAIRMTDFVEGVVAGGGSLLIQGSRDRSVRHLIIR